MSYFETMAQKENQRIHKQSVQSTRVNGEISISGTLSTSKNCHGQDPQDLWESELHLPHTYQEGEEVKKEELRVRIGDKEEVVDMTSISSFERTVGKILDCKGIEGKLRLAIKIILLQKWGKKGPYFRPLQEKLIKEYADANFLDIPTF